jgi:hypothetical protein
MATKRLKVLIAVMTIILVFMLGFNAWHGENIVTEMQIQPAIETGSVASWEVNSWNVVLTWEIYTWEDVKVELANKVNALIGDYSISYAIVNECTTQVYDDYKHCIESAVGVSNAESTLFTKWMKPSNNWFGLMYKWKKRKFSSVEESIQVWVSLYKKNWWGKRITWADWLKGKSAYCQSACTNWAKAYNSVVKKLELD